MDFTNFVEYRPSAVSMEYRGARLSESELTVMQYIWDNPGISFGTIGSQFFSRWKKQTLNTLLARIWQKGFLEYQLEQKKIYSPHISRERYIRSLIDEVIPGGGEKIVFPEEPTGTAAPAIKLSDAELSILQYLWDHPYSGFGDICSAFSTRWVKQNINTILTRAAMKQVVGKDGKYYYPLITREEYVAQLVDEVLPGTGEKVLEIF